MSDTLADHALRLFHDSLARTRPERLVKELLQRDGARLVLGDTGEVLDLDDFDRVVVVAFGKAAVPMADATADVVGDRVTRGLVATRGATSAYGWTTFDSGHPVPTEQSLSAGRAALDLLLANDSERTLVLFLISGGGSAMLEAPRAALSLADLQRTGEALVTCGAVIEEINAVRRRLSEIKGGRLAAAAPRSRQVSLYLSDVNPGDVATIASGPTVAERPVQIAAQAALASDVVERYGLADRLPAAVIDAIAAAPDTPSVVAANSHHVLLDNDQLVAVTAELARAHDFEVVTALDLVEVEVTELAAQLVTRALRVRDERPGRPVCLVAGGEAICPVRGGGRGGRNQELALRVALAFDAQRLCDVAFLSAGTDGIDGNSPAAGAVCDPTSIERGRAAGLDADALLAESDSYTFFAGIGDAIETGPTAHNVRDLRILLGGPT